MISEQEAKRCFKWVKDAETAGASILVGGKVDGSFFGKYTYFYFFFSSSLISFLSVDITILENVPETADVYCKEIFGYVLSFSAKFEGKMRGNDQR